MKSLAARIHAFGQPEDVLATEEIDVPDPGPGEILVRMLAAPINPADINIIEGKYGALPPLPATIGNEGIGRVEQSGSDDAPVRPGQLVRPLAPGAWSEWRILRNDEVAALPADIDIDQASMLGVNPPSAYGMLTAFGPIGKGGWVVQNAANSGVGRCVIQIARRLGFRTLNVVRRPELVAELEALGADAVVTEECDLRENALRLTGGHPPRLALNAVGGASALNLANALARGGVHVTYGAMGRQPLKIPNSVLIFRNLAFRGFWLRVWRESLSDTEWRSANEFLAEMVRDGALRVPVAASYPLRDVRAAVAHAAAGQRDGKVLLRMA